MNILIKPFGCTLIKPNIVEKFDITKSHVSSGEYYSAMFINNNGKIRIYRLYNNVNELIKLIKRDIGFSKKHTVVFCMSHKDKHEGILPLNGNLLDNNGKKIITCNIGIVFDTKHSSNAENKTLTEMYEILRDRNVRQYIDNESVLGMIDRSVNDNSMCILNSNTKKLYKIGSGWDNYKDKIYFSRFMSDNTVEQILGIAKTTSVTNAGATGNNYTRNTNTNNSWFDCNNKEIKTTEIIKGNGLQHGGISKTVRGNTVVYSPYRRFVYDKLKVTYTDHSVYETSIIYSKNYPSRCPACYKYDEVYPMGNELHICERCNIIYSSKLEEAIAYNKCHIDVVEIIKLLEKSTNAKSESSTEGNINKSRANTFYR